MYDACNYFPVNNIDDGDIYFYHIYDAINKIIIWENTEML